MEKEFLLTFNLKKNIAERNIKVLFKYQLTNYSVLIHVFYIQNGEDYDSSYCCLSSCKYRSSILQQRR